MIQILAKDALRKASFRRALYRTLAVTCIAFVALVVLLSEAVVVVTYAGGAAQEAFAVGFGQRPESCASVCSPGASDVTCILELTGADLESCWGSTRIRRTNTILLFAYLGAMLGFGGLSGLAVLQGLGRKR